MRLIVECPDDLLPAYKSKGAAGLDLRSAEDRTLFPGEIVPISTKLKVQIPEGYEGQIRGRSGMAFKHHVFVPHIGTIDSDYRGYIRVLLQNKNWATYQVSRGDRIAQLIIAPVTRVKLIQGHISSSDRGSGGFGSTGK